MNQVEEILSQLKDGDKLIYNLAANVIENQQKRIEELEKALRITINQLSVINCFQGCNNGVIQDSEDDIYQCQWCGEQEYVKNILTK